MTLSFVRKGSTLTSKLIESVRLDRVEGRELVEFIGVLPFPTLCAIILASDSSKRSVNTTLFKSNVPPLNSRSCFSTISLCLSRVDSDHLDAVEPDSDTCRETIGDVVDDAALFDS